MRAVDESALQEEVHLTRIRRWAWRAFCAAILSIPGNTMAGDSVLVVTPENSAEEVYFPSNEMLVATDYDGLSKITAKMSAFSISDGKLMWHRETEVGKKFQMLNQRFFFDDLAGWFYIGNGPVTAIEATSGVIKWVLPFKEAGVVRWVRPGEQSLLVLGADRDNDVNNYDDLKKHFEKPMLLSVNKEDGKILWKFKFNCPEDPGDVHVLYIADPTDADSPVTAFDRGRSLVKGKQLMCIDNKSGQELWRTKETAYGEPVVAGDTVFVNLDKRVVALRMTDGTEIWRCEKSVDKAAGMQRLENGSVLVSYPGEFKDGKNSGDYRLSCVSSSDGKLLWQFDDGKDFVGIVSIESGTIYLADATAYRTIGVANGKEISKSKRDKNYGMGTWLLQDRVIDIGEKGVQCCNANRKTVLWQAKYDRAKRGQSFMMKMLKGLSTVMTVASAQANAQDPDRQRMMMQEYRQRREEKKLQQQFNPTNRKREESSLWKRPYSDADFGTTVFTNNVVVFPTHGKGIVGISVDTGQPVWTLPTSISDPLPFFSPDNTIIAVADGKKLLVKTIQ
jgi:outer membrane protein assembly factor BamB